MTTFQGVIALTPESRSSSVVKQVEQHGLTLDLLSSAVPTATAFSGTLSTTLVPAAAILSTTFDLGEAVIQPLIEDSITNGATTTLLLLVPEDDSNLPSSAFASLSSMLSSIPRRIQEVEKQLEAQFFGEQQQQQRPNAAIHNNNNNRNNNSVKIVVVDHDETLLPLDFATREPVSFFNNVQPIIPRDEGWSQWLQSQWLADHQNLQQQDHNHHRRQKPQPKLFPAIIETETENFSQFTNNNNNNNNSPNNNNNQFGKGKFITVVAPIPSNEFFATMLAVQSSTTSAVLSSLSSAVFTNNGGSSQLQPLLPFLPISSSSCASSASAFPPPITTPMATFILDYLRHTFANPASTNCVLLSVPDLGTIADDKISCRRNNSGINSGSTSYLISEAARLMLYACGSFHEGGVKYSKNPTNSNLVEVTVVKTVNEEKVSTAARNNSLFSRNSNEVALPSISPSSLFAQSSTNNAPASSGFSLRRIGDSKTNEENPSTKPMFPLVKIGVSEYPISSNNDNDEQHINNNNSNNISKTFPGVSPSSKGDDDELDDDDEIENQQHDDEMNNRSRHRDPALATALPSPTQPHESSSMLIPTSKNDNRYPHPRNAPNTTTDRPFILSNDTNSYFQSEQQQQRQETENSDGTQPQSVAARGLELLNRLKQRKLETSSNDGGGGTASSSNRSNSVTNENINAQHNSAGGAKRLEFVENFVYQQHHNHNQVSTPSKNKNSFASAAAKSTTSSSHHQRDEEEFDFHQKIARFAALEAELKSVRNERDDLSNLLRKMSVRLTRAQNSLADKTSEATELAMRLAKVEADFSETRMSLEEAIEALKREELTSTKLLRKHAIDRIEAKCGLGQQQNNTSKSGRSPSPIVQNIGSKKSASSTHSTPMKQLPHNQQQQQRESDLSNQVTQLTQANERLRDMLMQERDETEVLKAALLSSMNGRNTVYQNQFQHVSNNNNNINGDVFDQAATALLKGLEIVSTRFGIQSLEAPERIQPSSSASSQNLRNIHPADVSLAEEYNKVKQQNTHNLYNGSENDLTVRALRKLKAAVDKLRMSHNNNNNSTTAGRPSSGINAVLPRVAASEGDVNALKVALTAEQTRLRHLDDLMLPFGALLKQSLLTDREEDSEDGCFDHHHRDEEEDVADAKQQQQGKNNAASAPSQNNKLQGNVNDARSKTLAAATKKTAGGWKR